MSEFKRYDRKLKYKGAIIDIYTDYITTPDGNNVEWDFIGHKGAAAVLPVMDDGTILMVRQWRNAIDRYALEIPAGGKDGVDEPTDLCAARELEEETGYKSDDIEFLQTIVPAIAYSQETIDIYIARNLKPSKQNLDPDEYINVERYTIEELLHKVFSNEIQDSKTAAAITNYYCKYCIKKQ
ncbi:MAG: NUDIX hydrolase [Lachnospiraceae bacterium]|nr:NUDIX hydrolase [Lachnospiraceae bacterium]